MVVRRWWSDAGQMPAPTSLAGARVAPNRRAAHLTTDTVGVHRTGQGAAALDTDAVVDVVQAAVVVLVAVTVGPGVADGTAGLRGDDP